MSPRRQLKRSNVFVLRGWTQESDDPEKETKWQGQVRRAVDGQAHDFDDWQSLRDWLIDNVEGSSTRKSVRAGTDPKP